jgi:CRISPR system Cascade subunit CasB
MSEESNKPKKFIDYLEEFVRRDDRAVLSRLRHSLSDVPERQIRAFAVIEPFTSSLEGWSREAYYLAGGLYATHPERSEEEHETLGATFKRVYLERGESPSIEQRFLSLLDADTHQLPDRLRHAITLIRSEAFAVNYELLLRQLLAWRQDSRWVQQRWARDFYKPIGDTETTTANETESTTEAHA